MRGMGQMQQGSTATEYNPGLAQARATSIKGMLMPMGRTVATGKRPAKKRPAKKRPAKMQM